MLYLPISFFFSATATTGIYTLSLHDALPIWTHRGGARGGASFRSAGDGHRPARLGLAGRSEEHTSELQSPYDLVCRLLLEKKNKLLTAFIPEPATANPILTPALIVLRASASR